jgi:hypothetical protein
MRSVLCRIEMALYGAAATVGLFTVTGFPGPVRRQIAIAVACAASVQVYAAFRSRRRSRGVQNRSRLE